LFDSSPTAEAMGEPDAARQRAAASDRAVTSFSSIATGVTMMLWLGPNEASRNPEITLTSVCWTSA
jgi:hypothetical protein